MVDREATAYAPADLMLAHTIALGLRDCGVMGDCSLVCTAVCVSCRRSLYMRSTSDNPNFPSSCELGVYSPTGLCLWGSYYSDKQPMLPHPSGFPSTDRPAVWLEIYTFCRSTPLKSFSPVTSSPVFGRVTLALRLGYAELCVRSFAC